MKLLIIGHAQHGKDEVCTYLVKLLGLEYTSSSVVATDLGIFDGVIKKFLGAQHLSMKQQRVMFYANKDSFRPEMYEEIRKFNAIDKTALAREIFKDFDIYCGLRDLEEFDAIKRARLTDLVIWVDASLRVPAEPNTSMKLTKNCADIIIENNGTKAELLDKVERLAALLKNMED